MEEYQKYQHIERFGTVSVQGIENGKCYIFPKMDGTNSQVWEDSQGFHAGSRNRELSLESDNAGFMNHIINQDNIRKFCKDYPKLRLFGEWLVPHTLKDYNDNAWRDFYVFDVMNYDGNYLKYEEYSKILESYGINYLKPLQIIEKPTIEQLTKVMDNNTFLMKEGCVGEGIVIKRYDFSNKFGRNIWAKMVHSEFHQKKTIKCGKIDYQSLIEEKIVNKYITEALVKKELAKIESDMGWESKYIPKLIGVVYYSLVQEESWNFIKEFKNPTINYKMLQNCCIQKIKELIPELF